MSDNFWFRWNLEGALKRERSDMIVRAPKSNCKITLSIAALR